MSTFLGLGLGPIQTGIFLAGAVRGGFDRIVIAEVNDMLKRAVNAAHGVTIHIAAADGVYSENYTGIEVLNPMIPAEKELLVAAAAEATEVATALPGVRFYDACSDWLNEGFSRNPGLHRLVYTAENHNHAAEALAAAVGGNFPNTHYLNTVIGKMSGTFLAGGAYAPLAPGAATGHLVEEFNRIYISDCPGVEKRRVANLVVKPDLAPFEDAKLYGHNAVHFLLGLMARERGCIRMDEVAAYPELLDFARAAFLEEAGAALLKKYAHVRDDLFTVPGFAAHVDDLLKRMVNPFLRDAVERIVRDPERKLGWDDRVVGTMRMALEAGIEPWRFSYAGKLALVEMAGMNARAVLHSLWPRPWSDLHEKLALLIEKE